MELIITTRLPEACPECGCFDLHFRSVENSDIIAVWCEHCNYSDGL